MKYERRIFLIALAGGFPAVALALVLLYLGGYSAKVQITFGLLVVLMWLGLAQSLRERVVRPLQVLSNLLAALREGDYSVRARGARLDDALGLAMAEVNAISEPLREQHVGALETAALLRTVMSEIDVAIFAFDDMHRLVFVNRGGERLLGQSAERLNGRDAAALNLEQCLTGDSRRVMEATFAGRFGRWEQRRGTFRRGGTPHHLLMLADLSKTLREEERQVWQRLIRVLSHEINNSLAPIKSIATSLQDLSRRTPRPADLDEDLWRGLAVISGRAESLNRFMDSYARLARLPRPRLQTLEVTRIVHEIVDLEKRVKVHVNEGPSVSIEADGDQLAQLLINIVSNAVDAVLETGGGVSVGWEMSSGHLMLEIVDEGPGLPDAPNIFVPFFTTKPSGSGIGLVLSRQIAEAHGGSLSLENRRDRRGCVATVRIPQAGFALNAGADAL